MIDLNKMSLEEVEEYCRRLEYWYLHLFVGNEGYRNAVEILRRNGRI